MKNVKASGFLLLALAALAGCDGDSARGAPTYSTPTSPSSPPSATAGLPFVIEDVTVSGVVYEKTPTGDVPIEGASISNGEGPGRMTPQLTDANGFFSFRGVWVCPCTGDPGNGPVPAGMTFLIVRKNGYQDPPELQESVFRPHDTGYRDVMIAGNTHVRLQLVKR
jgi:hypothetical protein